MTVAVPRLLRRLATGLLALVACAALGAQCTPPPPDGPEGALVVLPVLTGGVGRIADDQGETFATVTNTLGSPVRLALEVVSGDPGELWRSTSFVCDLVGGATTTFVFSPVGGGSVVSVECADLDLFGFPETRTVSAEAANGIFVVAATNPTTGAAIYQNRLLAEAVVVDYLAGQAFELPAVRIRGRHINDGDQAYRFDGIEYGLLPAGLKSPIVLPDTGAGESVELVLFTLDGTTGRIPPPRVSVGGLGQLPGVDIFGRPTVTAFDFGFAFDCFSVVDLLALSGGFAGTPGITAQLQLTAKPVGSPGTDVHDLVYGDGNSTRRRPVLGWVLERRGAGATGRLLPELPGRIAPFAGDEPPVFDTRVD